MRTALNQFITKIAQAEAKGKQVSVGNIREVLKVVNEELDGKLYELINEKYGSDKSTENREAPPSY